jgi:hypothetical protein
MKWLTTYETIVKPSYILKVIHPIAAVMVKIHSLAVAMRALRSIVLAVCDTFFANYGIYPKIDFKLNIQVYNPQEEQAYSLANQLAGIHNIIKSKISFT